MLILSWNFFPGWWRNFRLHKHLKEMRAIEIGPFAFIKSPQTFDRMWEMNLVLGQLQAQEAQLGALN